MSSSFEINATQDEFKGALLYELQRYSDNQYNMDASTTETGKSEATHVYILTVWKMKDSKPFARIALVEHTKGFSWNEDKLKELCDKNYSWLKEHNDTTSDTWLVNDNMILKTTFRTRDLKRTPELGVFISEEEIDSYTMRPLCVDLERWVVLEMSAFSVLIFIVSLTL
jgi:hypothetical protein